jgi:hypothetical protein
VLAASRLTVWTAAAYAGLIPDEVSPAKRRARRRNVERNLPLLEIFIKSIRYLAIVLELKHLWFRRFVIMKVWVALDIQGFPRSALEGF